MPSLNHEMRQKYSPTVAGQLTLLRRALVQFLVVLLLLSQTFSAFAQGPPGGGRGGGGGGRGGFGGGGFGGGGFGGFGGRGGLGGLLRRDNVKEELKITPEQDEKIREVLDAAAAGGMPDFGALGEKWRAATTDEERAKIGEEMRVEGEKRRKESEAKLKASLKPILTPEQMTRLEQLALQELGLGALRDETISGSLKLTDDQKKQVQTLMDDYTKKVMAGGFQMSREERDQLKVDRDAALQKLMTADQKQQWDAKLGPIAAPAPDAGRDRGDRRGGGPRTGSSGGRPSQMREEKVPDGATVVADLTGGSGKPADLATADAGEKTMSFNFRYAPWELVLKHFAEHAGLTLDLDVVPKGTFNYFDDNKFTITQALDVLNGYLSQKGYLLVRRDKFLVVVASDNIPQNVIPQVPLKDLPNRGRFELVSVLLPLDGMDPEQAADEAAELLGTPQGKIVPLTRSGRLLVTDLAVNVQRIHDLLTGLGGDNLGEGPVFKSYQLKHVSVLMAESVVRDLFNLPHRPIGGSSAPAATTTSRDSSRSSSGYPGSPGGFPGWGGGGWGGWGGPGGGGWGGRDGGGRDGGGRDGGGRDGGGRGGDNNRQMTPSGQSSQPASVPSGNAQIKVAIDTRTNTLMVTAKPDDQKVVESALKTLDIDDKANNLARNLTGNNSPQLEVYPITTADPLVLIQTINSVIPAAIVNEDAKAKRLHVFATADEQQQIKALIQQIDGGVEGGETARVVQIRKLDPLAVAGSLRKLYTSNREDAPMIEADAIGRRLMIRGTTAQVNELCAILKQMGEDPDGTGMDSPGERGPVRTLSLGGRDPREFVELIEQIWPGRDSNPIRIVVPSAIAPTLKSGSIIDGKKTSSKSSAPAAGKSAGVPQTKVPTAGITEALIRDLESFLDNKTVDQELEEATTEKENPKTGKEDATSAADADSKAKAAAESPETQTEIKPDPNRSAKPDADAKEAETPAEAAEEAAEARTVRRGSAPKAAGESDKPVVMAPSGNNLIIASDDLEALDRLQSMIEALTLAAPKRTTWTVFYLRTADATETATMLGHLFPSGSVSASTDASSSTMMGSLTGGISSFGSSLMDMTGLSNLGAANALRIVPETRSNALYVSGPTDLVRQVEDVLKVLDASELPESMRDRLPRMIPVEYADVDEVAAIIESVYKDYMTAPAAMPGGGGGGGLNPLALLMAAGGGGGDAKSKRGIRLTIGVDARTNSIVVSADEALYRQVEALVSNLDKAALEAKRTVRVMTVNQGSSHLVQQALGKLMGKVRVSTTGGGPSSFASPDQPSSNDSQPGGGQRSRGARGGNGGNGGGGQEDVQRAMEQQLRQQFLQGAGLVPPGGGNNGGRGGPGGGGPGGGRGGFNGQGGGGRQRGQ